MNKKLFFLIIIALQYNLAFSQTNWELLNPRPTANTGKDVDFVSNNIGYIITSSEILETLDSGITWSKKQNISSGNDMSFKGSIGYIVGDYGYILKTNNSGTTWNQISTGSNISFNTVNIIDNDNIILSGASSIVKTNDGGLSWTTLDIPNVTAKKTWFSSSLVGHAVCNNGKILKTIDGGATWYSTYSTNLFPSDFFTVYFVNQNIGFASREHDNIFKTTDAGETWTQMASPSQAVYDFYFLDENKGFAVGEHGGTYKTTDGGISWSNILFQNGYYGNTSMYGVFFQNSNIGFSTGARGRIIKTQDGGSTWTQHSPTYNDVRQLQVVNNSIAYAQTGNQFYKTNNFGDSWTLAGTLNLGTSVVSSDFVFVNENVGYATTGSTYGGHVYKTIDGGINWSILNNGNDIIDEGITAICFLNENTGFISGGYNSRKVMKTTNGGNSWAEVSNQSFGNIQFLSPTIGYGNRIGNYYGAMYKTTDGGNTWNLSIELAGENINSFHFIDENTGFIVGDDSLCYKTTDGGATWHEVTVPYGYYKLTKFYNQNTGYIIDEYGVVYKTINGGLNWNQIANQYSINSIELANNYIFTAGISGKIYRSYTGIPILNSTESLIEKQIFVYPNPASDYVHIKLPNNEKLDFVDLYSAEGKRLESKKITDYFENIKIDVSSIAQGVYFLKLYFKNHTTVTKKIIKK